jgi:ABC-type Fe3+/spermidine/putrescine transport system ATPase subunit
MSEVVLKGISKAFQPGVSVLADINLAVGQGELTALLGPSGSGKTTLLRLVAGLTRPSRGDILFDGRSMDTVPPEKRGAVMVFQDHAVFPFMSVGENIAFGLKIKRVSRSETRRRVAEALEAVQLAGFEDRAPASLSGGQRQRVALARALVIQPQVLLLDEPLSNLEPALRTELREMIRRLQKQTGITTIFVTHDQTEAFTIADRVVLLINGRIRQAGAPRSFFERPVGTDVAGFFGGQNFVQGTKRGRSLQTELGELEISRPEMPDGEVLLAIQLVSLNHKEEL